METETNMYPVMHRALKLILGLQTNPAGGPPENMMHDGIPCPDCSANYNFLSLVLLEKEKKKARPYAPSMFNDMLELLQYRIWMITLSCTV